MKKTNTSENDYPQKIYDTLANPEFREYLGLAYKEFGGNKELFRVDIIEVMGNKAKEYVDILYLVGSKE